ncbi:molecular chaperone [Erythrobacter litoralis]|uniref:ATP12 family chaperone protein n=1 Tax=Erythrobacter litoralis TaxID=39960 RepID=UPI002435CB34|nr:ATP12 family protein [Erythrobacter litoralis]MDG6077997.1 molecular chaperone [Erythrobacter litoralis]
MKRFYAQVAAQEAAGGWIVHLDDRPLKTQGGRPQLAPSVELAELLAAEWRGQDDEIDPSAFRFRDMADYAIDVVRKEPDVIVDKLLGYAETDTLCYRADPEDPLYRRQQEVWEPLLAETEAREGVRFHRVSGILHRAQAGETLATLRNHLERLDPFKLAALEQLVSLSASLCIGLAALEPGADADALWNAANLEEDWQAERWGKDEEAAARREGRRKAFLNAIAFARSVKPG